MAATIRVALYARVSSDKQADELTIHSQIAALQQRIAADGLQLEPELSFVDDGYSGAHLQRPALERLRDLAYSGVIDRLYLHAPDRLARNYAHQVVLLEELAKQQVEVVFLNAVAGAASPEANLLLQMQGMIAEYERAKILERTRRGRRFAARQGKVSALGHAPYGYRYVRKGDGDGEARYEIVAADSRVLQTLFQWVGIEGLSLGDVAQRLQQQGVPTPSGQAHWDRSTLREILRNPAYQGTARFGKTRLEPRVQPIQRRTRRASASQLPHASDRPLSRRCADRTAVPTTPAEQETIAVPALVSAELFAATAERLDHNRRRYRQQKQGSAYLLSGLVVCGQCQSAYCGRRHRPRSLSATPREYVYYRCLGSDAGRHQGQAICQNPSVPAHVEAVVWSDLESLRREPEHLRREFEQRLSCPDQDAAETARLQQAVQEQKRRIARLLDAYENGWADKAEFAPRMRTAKERLAKEESKLRAHQDASLEAATVTATLHEFQEFASVLEQQLERADWATKRKLLQLLIDRIEIDTNEIRIVYKVSLRPFAKAPTNGGFLHDCLMFQTALQAERHQACGLDPIV